MFIKELHIIRKVQKSGMYSDAEKYMDALS